MPRLVLAHVRDLLFSSRIGETARHLGCAFRVARTPGEFEAGLAERPNLVLVDLAAPKPDVEAVLDAAEGAGRPAPILGWTSHALWKATGPLHGRCDRVVTRDTLTAELPELLRRYLGDDAQASVCGGGC